MTARLLKALLRCIGVILVAFAAVMAARGGVSFTSPPEQISNEEYVVRHTLILPRSFIIIAIAGVLIFASTLLIRSKTV